MHRIQNQGNRNHDNKKKDIDTYDALVQKYAQPIPCKSWRHCCSESLPIVQEFALVVFFLARFQLSVQWQAANLRHRKLLEERLDNGHACILLGFCLVIILRLLCQRQRQPRNRQQTQMKATKAPSRLVMKDSRTKARHRLTDACLLGVLLRLLASVLRRLTASYSTDTVEALTIAAMALHLLTCDYTYSSSIPDTTTTTVPSSSISSSSSSSSLPQLKRNRPPFRGGTVSLNASFFATVLCISRLESDLTSYFFCSLAVICFGFYPQSRAELMQEYPPRSSGTYNFNTTCKICHMASCP